MTSAVEHHAVLHTVQQLERRHGFDCDRSCRWTADGRVDPADVLAAVRDDTALVSVMYANNEVGAVQPVAEIAAALADHPALVHTDAVQAAGSLSLATPELGVDLLSLTAHKVYGPKGRRRPVRAARRAAGAADCRGGRRSAIAAPGRRTWRGRWDSRRRSPGPTPSARRANAASASPHEHPHGRN